VEILDFFLNYFIASCIFNFIYYIFDLETCVYTYIQKLDNFIIKEMERKDPFHPFLKYLKTRQDYNKVRTALYKKPILKVTLDLIYFPITLTILICIFFVKLTMK